MLRETLRTSMKISTSQSKEHLKIKKHALVGCKTGKATKL